ncbi:hypothetical protein [Phaffia rhodozyma]|uniref:Uncharacterized protein n=1 Tax=Phaffia rhodozyma TaxID=264483 RepID=A0A0F7SHB4_PHARH|nr:hypothetical protein [Phaffia rhodozyma]
MRSVFILAATALSLLTRFSDAAPTVTTKFTSIMTRSVEDIDSVDSLFPFDPLDGLGNLAGQMTSIDKRHSEIRVPRWHVDNEPSSVFSKQQLIERPSRMKRSKPSNAQVSGAPINCGYHVQIIDSQGDVRGYLAVDDSNAASTFYIYTQSASDALKVSVPSSSPGNLAFANSGNKNVGAIVGPNSPSSVMSADSYNYLALTASASTSANSGPEYASNNCNTATGRSLQVETSIWTYTSSSSSLTTRWVNPDGSVISMLGMVGNKSKAIFLVGNQSKFSSRYTADTYSAVTFKLVPT